jgi:hypothetical protein
MGSRAALKRKIGGEVGVEGGIIRMGDSTKDFKPSWRLRRQSHRGYASLSEKQFLTACIPSAAEADADLWLLRPD